MRVTRLISLLTVIFIFAACAGRYNAMQMPKVSEGIDFEPVKPEEWVLDNGLRVVFIQDRELPLVRGSLHIPRGTLWEKNGDSEVIAAMGYLMRQGGTRELSPDALDYKLEKLAASIESDYGAEIGNIGFICLKSDFPEVFDLFSDVVLEPQFAEARTDLWKGQMLEAIRRRIDDPNTVAGVSFRRLIYGDNAFGSPSTSAEINAISRADLMALHDEFVIPQGAYLAVIGDIEKETLREQVEKQFGSWKGHAPDPERSPSFTYEIEPGIYFIEQPLEQATIYIGQQGPARLPPEYVAIEAFNNIFGSGDFGARLFSRIRTELGLAYALYGSIMNSFLVGQNVIILQTKSASAGDAVTESLKILSQMKDELVTSEELERSKKATTNSFVFKNESPDQALKRYVLLKLLGYPEDYDETYLNKVEALKRDEIREVVNKYWDLNELVVVVVGNKTAYNDFSQELKNLPSSLATKPIRVCKFRESLEDCS